MSADGRKGTRRSWLRNDDKTIWIWSSLITKAGEYLEAGVSIVCLLDQVSETVQVYRADELPRALQVDDELHHPDILGDLRIPVRRFFE